MANFFDRIFGKWNYHTDLTNHSVNTNEPSPATGGGSINELAELIYRGKSPAYTLSAGTYNRQITTAARLLGCPILENEKIQKLLQDEFQNIVIMSMVNGTHWILPYSWGLLQIKDRIIGEGGLHLDPRSRELEAVITNEQINWYDGDDFSYYKTAGKRTVYTADKIIENWTGDITGIETRRSSGMPIPFAFNSVGDYRGISAYSNVIELLRDIHSMRRNRDDILATIRNIPVIKVRDFDEFIETNLLANRQASKSQIEAAREAQQNGKTASIPSYKPLEAKVVVLNGNDDVAEYTMLPPPTGLSAEYATALDDLIREQVTSSPLPELLSGKMTTGNYASVEAHVELTIDFVRSMRREYTKSTDTLIQRLAALDPYGAGERIEWSWDNVELTSAATRSTVLSNIINALNTTLTAGIPIELAFKMIKGINPGMPYKTAEELKEAVRQAKADIPANDELIGEWI